MSAAGPMDPPLGRRLKVIAAICVISVVFDQWTKELAMAHLQGLAKPIELVGDMFILTYAHNYGAFLGLGSGMGPDFQFWTFVVFNVLLLGGVLLFSLRSRQLPGIWLHGMAWVLSGGIGNMIDRVRFGYVVDFMNVGIDLSGIGLWHLRSGIFNIADLAIVGGVIMICLHKGPEDPAQADEAKKQAATKTDA